MMQDWGWIYLIQSLLRKFHREAYRIWERRERFSSIILIDSESRHDARSRLEYCPSSSFQGGYYCLYKCCACFFRSDFVKHKWTFKMQNFILVRPFTKKVRHMLFRIWRKHVKILEDGLTHPCQECPEAELVTNVQMLNSMPIRQGGKEGARGLHSNQSFDDSGYGNWCGAFTEARDLEVQQTPSTLCCHVLTIMPIPSIMACTGSSLLFQKSRKERHRKI